MLVQRIPHHQASYTQPNSIWMTHSGNDRLLMGSPLRRRGISKAITAALLVILVFATLVQLVVFIGMSPGLFGVFLRALALSSLLALVSLAILCFLDRREREAPWLFAAALWVDRHGTCPAVQHRLFQTYR